MRTPKILGMLITILFSFNFLGPEAMASRACEKCAEIAKLKAEALKMTDTELNSTADKRRARHLITRTAELLGEHNLSSNNQEDIEEFRQLVHLVADILPFDPLSSVADHLNSEMSHKEGGKRLQVYKSALAEIKNPCKKQLLDNTMREYQCRDRITSDAQSDKCIVGKDFSYESCQKAQK